MKVSVPVDPTNLVSQSYTVTGKSAVDRAFPFTVPDSVNVIEVTYYLNINSSLQASNPWSSYVRGNVTYVSHSIKNNTATKTVYVGVTPGKSYTLSHHADVYNKILSLDISYSISVKYSQSINQQTPTILDY